MIIFHFIPLDLFIFTFRNSYKCVNNTCVISKIASAVKEYDNINGSLDVCRLTCGPYGSLWPKPTVKTVIG